MIDVPAQIKNKRDEAQQPQAPQAILSAVSGSIESSIGTKNYHDVSGNGLMFPRLA